MTPFRLSLVAVAVGCVALPVAIWHRAELRLAGLKESVRRQAEELSQLAVANEQLSNLVAQARAPRILSEQERLELLGLRSEVGRLRQQTNLAAQSSIRNPLPRDPGEAVSQPSAHSRTASQEEALVAQTVAALNTICLGLQPALQRYASEHTNQAPSDLLELREYFPASGGPVPGLYSFEFLSDTCPPGAPGDALVLRSRNEHPTADGKWMRLYAFGDGRIVQANSDKRNFEKWESQHNIWPPATTNLLKLIEGRSN